MRAIIKRLSLPVSISDLQKDKSDKTSLLSKGEKKLAGSGSVFRNDRNSWEKFAGNFKKDGKSKNSDESVAPKILGTSLHGIRIDVRNEFFSATPVAAGLKTHGATSGQLLNLRKDIETMMSLKKEDAKSDIFKNRNKEFQKAYKNLFTDCNFKHEKIAINFEKLKDALLRLDQPNKGLLLPVQTRYKLHEAVMTENQKKLFEVFRQALIALPINIDENELAEAFNPSNLYVFNGSAGQEASSMLINEKLSETDKANSNTKSSTPAKANWDTYGTKLPNEGGGDCLLHALAGRNLTENEVIELRAKLADIRRNLPDEEANRNLNALQLANGLYQTPIIQNDVVRNLTYGRHSIPNDVYAKFQAIPGMYAGEDELKQWTLLEGNQAKSVVVIDRDQTVAAYRNGERTVITADKLDDEVKKSDVLLYKTDQHWEQIQKWDQVLKSS